MPAPLLGGVGGGSVHGERAILAGDGVNTLFSSSNWPSGFCFAMIEGGRICFFLNCRFYFSVVNLALIAPFIAARAAELNAVGYANVPYGEGYALIANLFCYKENRVDQVLP